MNEEMKLQEITTLIEQQLDLAPDDEEEYGPGCYIIGIDKAAQAILTWHQGQLQLTEAEIEQEATEYANSKQKNKNIIWVNLRAGYKAALLARNTPVQLQKEEDDENNT